MPRVKRTPTRTKSSPVWYAHPHSLQSKTRSDICSLLGFDITPGPNAEKEELEIVAPVELLLGRYPGAVGAMDNAPRPADYRARCAPLRDEAFTLLKRIGGLDTWMRDALEVELREAHKIDPLTPDRLYAIERALAALASASDKVTKTYGTSESRGRTKQAALRELVAALREVFRKHRGGDQAERVRVGAQSNLTEYENDEVDFLEAALDDAGIAHPTNIRERFNEI